MSDDPETARQIAELARDSRPLLVLDVDEVVLEFIGPFIGFLGAQELLFRTASFRLHGNVIDRATGAAIDDARVSRLMEDFFEAQDDWQTVALEAREVVAEIAEGAEVVMLTAMPHRWRDKRRALLDRLGFPYPLVTTEAAKGPAIKALRGDTARPVAFVDDIPRNLLSALKSVPDIAAIHLMAHGEMRALLPPLDADLLVAEDWPAALPLLRKALGLARPE